MSIQQVDMMQHYIVACIILYMQQNLKDFQNVNAGSNNVFIDLSLHTQQYLIPWNIFL
jgi:hypothetical protein